MLASMASCIPVGSPTNSARWAAMPRAVLRSDGDRPAPWRCSTSSQSESSGRGTPARTRRGRSTRPWCVGAGATADPRRPAHFAVSAQ